MEELDAEEFDFERMYEEELEMMRDTLEGRDSFFHLLCLQHKDNNIILQGLIHLLLLANLFLLPVLTCLLELDGRDH